MLYGQSAACRWKLLHEYFDESWEESAEDCDHCDNCLHPLEEQLGLPEQLSAAAAYRKPSASSTDSGEEKSETDLSKGDQVSVKKYGEGEIKAVDDDKVVISFPDGQTRTFKKDFVE
jgi:ATP-dependent DNA helicase RecQ